MTKPTRHIDREVLAGALRDVLGEAAEQSICEGWQSQARLVRRLLANPALAYKLVDAFAARAVELRSETEPPLLYGPVAADGETYRDPPLMLDPEGSPEFEAAIDLVAKIGKSL